MTLNEAKAVIYGNVVYACEKAGYPPYVVQLVQDACDTIIALADRKTEPQPTTDCRQTDCYMCKWLGEVDVCGRCRNRNLFAEADTEPKPKDEPTTKTETQNSNLTFEKRTMRDCYNCKRYETEGECIECHYEPKTEDEILHEQVRAFMGIVEQTERSE